MKDYMTTDLVRRVLIRTAWEARKREKASRARLAELSLDDAMTHSIFFEASRAWQSGYKVSRLHAARLLPRKWEQAKKEIENG